jgi:hypothetical protein
MHAHMHARVFWQNKPTSVKDTCKQIINKQQTWGTDNDPLSTNHNSNNNTNTSRNNDNDDSNVVRPGPWSAIRFDYGINFLLPYQRVMRNVSAQR